MLLVLIALSFLIGSIPTGLLIARARGVDLRGVGSGNIGATNVLRALGKKDALLTLLGDMAKGALPLIMYKALFALGFHVGGGLPVSDRYAAEQGLLGLSSIAGHDFSFLLKGRGGKGVATSLGVLVILSPYVALFSALLWLITAKWTRYSSLSALVAFGLLPLSFYLIDYGPEKIFVAGVMALLIFFKHRDNIKRLLNGTESKIGEKG
ncbi:MAG: glycerol-3-phosphate 1-O-acyltransferase PlsY [Nitrospirae bacterium]|nr:glycerol-3-phosphate 1-O-acyltransferase PlsY [Nitrospirota bacterium]